MDLSKKILKSKEDNEKLKYELQQLIDAGLRSCKLNQNNEEPKKDQGGVVASARKDINVNLEEKTTGKKCRVYDVEAAREYIKKQQKKRHLLNKNPDNKRIELEERKKKLQELHKKSIELVTRNVRRAKSSVNGKISHRSRSASKSPKNLQKNMIHSKSHEVLTVQETLHSKNNEKTCSNLKNFYRDDISSRRNAQSKKNSKFDTVTKPSQLIPTGNSLNVNWDKTREKQSERNSKCETVTKPLLNLNQNLLNINWEKTNQKQREKSETVTKPSQLIPTGNTLNINWDKTREKQYERNSQCETVTKPSLLNLNQNLLNINWEKTNQKQREKSETVTKPSQLIQTGNTLNINWEKTREKQSERNSKSETVTKPSHLTNLTEIVLNDIGEKTNQKHFERDETVIKPSHLNLTENLLNVNWEELGRRQSERSSKSNEKPSENIIKPTRHISVENLQTSPKKLNIPTIKIDSNPIYGSWLTEQCDDTFNFVNTIKRKLEFSNRDQNVPVDNAVPNLDVDKFKNFKLKSTKSNSSDTSNNIPSISTTSNFSSARNLSSVKRNLTKDFEDNLTFEHELDCDTLSARRDSILSFNSPESSPKKSRKSVECDKPSGEPVKTSTKNTTNFESQRSFVNTKRGSSSPLPLTEPEIQLISNSDEKTNYSLKNITLRPKRAEKNNDKNKITLKFEAEFQLLDVFRESILHCTAVEESLKSLKNQNPVDISEIVKPPSYHTNTPSESSIISTVNSTRGSDYFNNAMFENYEEEDFGVPNDFNGFLAGVSLQFFDQLIKDEEAKLKNIEMNLMIRKKILMDKTKTELFCLEMQRKSLKTKGNFSEASAIKAKQRAILMNHQREEKEILRTRQMQNKVSEKRKINLRQTKDLIKKQLANNGKLIMKNRPKENRRQSGPVKVIQNNNDSILMGSEASICPNDTLTLVNAIERQKDVSRKKQEKLKRILSMHEATLEKRRRAVEELLQWHGKLAEEEKRVADLENRAEMVISGKEKEKHVFTGSELNKLWLTLTDNQEKKFPDEEIYSLSQSQLEKFLKKAKEFLTTGKCEEVAEEEKIFNESKADNVENNTGTTLEEILSKTESNLRQIIAQFEREENNTSNDVSMCFNSVDESQIVSELKCLVQSQKDNESKILSECESQNKSSNTNVQVESVLDRSKIESTEVKPDSKIESVVNIDESFNDDSKISIIEHDDSELKGESKIDSATLDSESKVESEISSHESVIELMNNSETEHENSEIEVKNVEISKINSEILTNESYTTESAFESDNSEKSKIENNINMNDNQNIEPEIVSLNNDLDKSKIDSDLDKIDTEIESEIINESKIDSIVESEEIESLKYVESDVGCEKSSISTVVSDVKQRVNELMDQQLQSSNDKSPRIQDLYVTTYDLVSPVSSPESGSPVSEKVNSIFGNEAEELLKKQLAIEKEIKQITEQQQKQQVSFVFVREIPNKPPPPYTPPGSLQLTNNNLTMDICIIPSAEEVRDIVPSCARILHKAFLSNNLESITLSKKTMQLIATNMPKERFGFVFDLCKDLACKHYRKFPKVKNQTPSWMRHNKKLSAGKPLDSLGLGKYLLDSLREMFNFEKTSRRENTIIKWSRKKRDHVDEVLVVDCQEEESKWTNCEKDKLLIMDKMVNEIMNALLLDSCKVFERILKKKAVSS